MGKYKASICALLVTTSLVGYSNIILASTNKVDKGLENNTTINEEILIPKRPLLVKTEVDELEIFVPEKIMNVKDVQAAKVKSDKILAKLEEEKLAAKKAEEAKIAAAKKAEEEKIAAAKAQKEKLAAKKAQEAKKTASSSTKITASRGSSAATVSAEKAQEIIEYGKQFMGVKYVFGGASPSGFDCSGFTMYVYNKFGISLPHSAKAQAGIGVAVSKSELIPGDLVFFETYKPGISHVGIYIGNGNFLEASSSRGIAITKLSSSYYKNRYMGATRILK